MPNETTAGTVFLDVKLDDQAFKREMATLATEAQRIMQQAVTGGTFGFDVSGIQKSLGEVVKSIDILGDNLMSTFSQSMEQGAVEGIKSTAKVVGSATFPKIKIEFSEAQLREQIRLMGQRWESIDNQRRAQAEHVARLQQMSRYSLPGQMSTKADLELAQAQRKLVDLKMAAAQADAQVYALEQRLAQMGQTAEGATEPAAEGLQTVAVQAQTTSLNVSSAMSRMTSSVRAGFARFGDYSRTFIGWIKRIVAHLNIFRRSSGSAFGGLNKLMRYGMMALGLRSIYMMVRRVVNIVKEGFGEMGQQFDGFQAKLTALKDGFSMVKASFAGMFAPIFEAIFPVIDALISKLVNVFNTVGMFFARIFGQTSYKKLVGYNAAVEAGAGAASASNEAHKKLFRTLASFDELEILQSPGSMAGGAGGGGAGSAGSPIYEEVAIEPIMKTGNLADAFNKWVDGIDARSLGKMLSDKFIAATDWLIDTIGRIDWRNLGTKIGEGWNAIDWAKVVSNTFNLIGTVFGGIVDFLSGFIAKVDWKEFGEGIYKGLQEVKWGEFGEKFWRLIGNGIGAVIGTLWGFMKGFATDIKTWWKNNAYNENDEFDMGKLANAVGNGIASIPQKTYRGLIKPLVIGIAEALDIELDEDTLEDDVKQGFEHWATRLVYAAIGGIKKTMLEFGRFLDATFVPMIRGAINGLIDVINTFLSMFGGQTISHVSAEQMSVESMIASAWGSLVLDSNPAGQAFKSFQEGGFSGMAGTMQGIVTANQPAKPAPKAPTGRATGVQQFAAGGYIKQPTLAMIGEDYKREVALPLDRNTEWADILAQRIAERSSGGGAQNVTIPVYLGTDTLVDVIEVAIDRQGRIRNAAVF